MDKRDKLRIEVYADNQFQGYLQHMSKANRTFDTTSYLQEAKTYSSITTANKDITLISALTNGACVGRVS